MLQKGYNTTVSANGNHVAQKFKYNGIEYEQALGMNLYEMELRQYDPTIARWTAIDPVTHHSTSTYNAFDNNPVFFSDPSGADATSLINDLWNKSGSGKTTWTNNNNGTFSSSDGQTAQCKDCKYEIFNAFFIGDKLSVRHTDKYNSYEDIVGYHYDPKHQAELHINALYDAINALEDNKLKLALLKRLGIVGKKASKILKFLSSKNYDAISSLIGLSTNDNFLANAPFPLGTMVDILDDDIQRNFRMADYQVTWDNAMDSFNSLLGIEDFNNIVIIYSNELLTTTSTISSGDSNIINSPYTATEWKYANVATQIGDQVYILKTYELKD
ncbi:MAG: hypothetical protein GKR88_08690 [Flavobacteriaceae bacterium]|nr:MAG: hypothetical protein GKR88_08690 [Flavobacteriaceae bacterium]